MRRILRIAFLLPMLASVQGCVTGMTSALMEFDAASLNIFQKQNVNLKEKNFAAADYLIHQARTYISYQDSIKVLPLLDAQEPSFSAPIGEVISEQVGLRLSQLGYAMNMSEVMLPEERANLGIPPASKASFTLSGTYQRQGQDLEVNLRITELSSARIIGSFEYFMPMSREIADLSTPEPRIFRISE